MFLPSDGLVADIVPTLDTGGYSTGDLLFAANQIDKATLNTKGLSYLRSLLVIDTANQKSALDLLIFDRDPGSLGTLNNAIDISTAQLGYLVAKIGVAAADYVTLKASTNAVAQYTPNILLPAKVQARDFWVAGISRGSPTYAASSLTFRMVLERQP